MAVYAKQYGRLGNNLFQKAAAIGYAMKHGLEYNLSPKIPKSDSIFPISELAHNYQELPYHFTLRWDDIVLDGYWQSEKYFSRCREEVLKAFGFPWELKKGWCSIHVRRGDYLKYPDKHPVVTMDYITKAIETIVDQAGVGKFLVFSDDLPWCVANFSHLGYYFYYSESRTPEQDMAYGSCCEHNIISNSTFSWWQAYLNQNPGKVVISPSKDNWFGPGNKHLDTSDLVPDSWIQIKY